MAIDKNALRQAADAASERIRARAPQGVAALPASIHKGGLGQEISIESVALPLIPEVGEGRWSLLSLLALPAGPGGPEAGIRAPWGAVRWSWPEAHVLEIVRFGDEERLSEEKAENLFLPRASGAQAELYRQLDRLLTGPPDRDALATLAGAYTPLLPQVLWPLIHHLSPGTRSWLVPGQDS